MLTRIFAVVMALGLGAFGVAWTAEKPEKPAGDCCAKKMACCKEKLACCTAEAKPGCCEKAMKCCAEGSACCNKAPECCQKGLPCCDAVKACCKKADAKQPASCCESAPEPAATPAETK